MPIQPAIDEGAERAVLGALLIKGEPRFVKALVGSGLSSEHFYWPRYAAVFEAAVELAERGVTIDPLLIATELKRLGKEWDQQEIDALASYVPFARNVADYAKQVREFADWRERLSILYEMADAVKHRDPDAFSTALARLHPTRLRSAAPSSPAEPRLRLVVDGDTGELMESSQHCQGCRTLEDELNGANKDIRAWRARFAELRRKVDDQARADGLWQTAAELFAIWKRMCNHPRSEFTEDRFYAIIPFLRNKKYGPVVCERAIAGIAYDPFTKPMRNGKVKRYDEWERVFSTAGKLEEFANRAPLDWKPTLRIAAETAPVVAVAAERAG